MADDSDGVGEAASTAVRSALTAAAQIAEQLARARQQAAYEAAAASTHQQRELAERLRAERSAARSELGVVHRADWWDHATPDAIGRAWQTAQAWQNDPLTGAAAAEAIARIRGQVRDRFGIDVDDLGVSPQAVRDALRQRDQGRGRETSPQAADRDGEADAAQLVAQATSQDHEEDLAQARNNIGLLDAEAASADDDHDHAAALDATEDQEAIEAQRIAAINQALPAQRAVSIPPQGTTRPARGGQQKQRPEPGRE